MNDQALDTLLEAASLDPCLEFRARDARDLLARRIVPLPYARERLFRAMASGRPALFRAYPSPLCPCITRRATVRVAADLPGFLAAFPSRRRHHLRVGRSGTFRRETVAAIARRWLYSRSAFGVTDLHVRDTDLSQVVEPGVLSWFDLLHRSSMLASEQEMFSLVISGRGAVTDSHSDDPDSSNYCFIGRKLWLIWETFEGISAGLEDVERSDVDAKACFDMRAFLSLRSARWLTVDEGHALFLPGSYTHRVITLRRYLGTGGFYVSLPNCLRSLARWVLHDPLWLAPELGGRYAGVLDDIARTARATVRRLRGARPATQAAWGLDLLPLAARTLARDYGKRRLERLDTNAAFRGLAREVDALQNS